MIKFGKKIKESDEIKMFIEYYQKLLSRRETAPHTYFDEIE